MEITTEVSNFLQPAQPQSSPQQQPLKSPNSNIKDKLSQLRAREVGPKVSLSPVNDTSQNSNTNILNVEDSVLRNRRKLSASKILATFSSAIGYKMSGSNLILQNSSIGSPSQQDVTNNNNLSANNNIIVTTNKETNPGSGWNFVRKLGKIKRFIEKMKVANPTSSFRRLNNLHFKILNDISYNIQSEALDSKESGNMQILLKNAFIRVSSDLWHLIKRMRVFNPDSFGINLWKMIILITTIVQIFLMPLIMSFQIGLDRDYEQVVLFKLPLFLFIMDMILNFNTGYYEEGGIMLSRKRIIKQYLSFQFWIDIVTLFFFVFREELNNYTLEHIFLLRLIQISDIVEDMDERWQIQQRFSASWTLIKLFLLIILLAHYCGCGFHYIGQLSVDLQQNCWIEKQQIKDDTWQVRYLYSLYFSFITMITVGYGDITPISNAERIYVTCMTIVSSGVFAYTVNTVGIIFQERSKKLAKYLQQKYDMSNYMRSRLISTNLQMKVSKYLDYIHRKEDIAPEKGQSILSTLPKHLREEVNQEFFGSILDNVKMLKFNFSTQFLNQLSLHMKENLYGPGEVIYLQGDDDKRIFYIKNGSVQLYLENEIDSEIVYLFDQKQEDEVFGELNFFTNLPRECCAKSNNVSHIVYCNQEDFLKTLKSFPNDFERFCQMRDELMNNCEKFNTRCYCCKKYQHSISDCPYLHYIRNKQVIIKRYNFSQPIKDREYFPRNTFKNGDSLKQLSIVRKNAKRYRQNIIEHANQEDSVDSIEDSSYEELEETDKQFILRTPAIKFEEGLIYVEENEQEDDEIDELVDESDSSDDNDSVSGKQNANNYNSKANHQTFQQQQEFNNNSDQTNNKKDNINFEVTDFDNSQIHNDQEQQNINNSNITAHFQNQSSQQIKYQQPIKVNQKQQQLSQIQIQNKQNNSDKNNLQQMFNLKLASNKQLDTQNFRLSQMNNNNNQIDVDEEILRDLQMDEEQLNQQIQNNNNNHIKQFAENQNNCQNQSKINQSYNKFKSNLLQQQSDNKPTQTLSAISEDLDSIQQMSNNNSNNNNQFLIISPTQQQLEEDEVKSFQTINNNHQNNKQLDINIANRNAVFNKSSIILSSSDLNEIQQQYQQQQSSQQPSYQELPIQQPVQVNIKQKIGQIQLNKQLENINEEIENQSSPIIKSKQQIVNLKESGQINNNNKLNNINTNFSNSIQEYNNNNCVENQIISIPIIYNQAHQLQNDNQQAQLQQQNHQQAENQIVQDQNQPLNNQSKKSYNVKFNQQLPLVRQNSSIEENIYSSSNINMIDDEKRQLKAKKKGSVKEDEQIKKPADQLVRKKSILCNDLHSKLVKKTDQKLNKKNTILLDQKQIINNITQNTNSKVGNSKKISQNPIHIKTQQIQKQLSKPDQQPEQLQQLFTQNTLSSPLQPQQILQIFNSFQQQQQQQQSFNNNTLNHSKTNKSFNRQDTNSQKKNNENTINQFLDDDFKIDDEDYKERLFLYEFDKMKLFKNYFPNGNHSVILANMKRKILQKILAKKASSKNIFQSRLLNKVNKSQKNVNSTANKDDEQKLLNEGKSPNVKNKIRIMDLIKIPINQNSKFKTNNINNSGKILLQPPQQTDQSDVNQKQITTFQE